MSTMLLTRAPMVGLLKHLHPSHFSVGIIYKGYATCVRKWSLILKAVARFRHIILYKNRKETLVPQKQEPLTPEDLDKGKRFLQPQSQLNFFAHEIKLMSVRLDSLNSVAKGLQTDIAQFNPYLDEYGIIRSNSRLTKLD